MVNIILNEFSALMAIVSTIVTVYINKNKMKKIMITFDYKDNLIMSAILCMRNEALISLAFGEGLCTMLNLGITLNNGVMIGSAFLSCIVVFLIIPIISIKLINDKKDCGAEWSKFKTNKVIYFLCMVFSALFNFWDYKYSIGLASFGTQSQESGSITFEESLNFAMLCFAFIVLLSAALWLLPNITKGKVYRVTEEQYKGFEIVLDNGVIYELHKDDVIKVNKDRDILIINSEEGKFEVKIIDNKGSCKTEKINAYYPIYIQNEHIEYIKDYKGKRIDY